MIALPIISIVACIVYVIFILFKYGVPVSLSETYYLLPNKWDWLFSAWTILTAIPFGIYWFTIAEVGLKWIPIVVMIALSMIGVADCYKSGPKSAEGYAPKIKRGDEEDEAQPHYYDNKPSKTKELWWNLIDNLKAKFNPKEFFKYGPARLIHYVNSLVVIILSTIYLCMVCGPQAIAGTIISYVVWLLIGNKVDGVYNPDYSLDVNNKSWIFFMEVVCFINIFIFIW